MRIDHFRFGSIRVDGVVYERDVVIDHGRVRPRHKGPSKRYRDGFGHTPLSADERIPWECRRLVIGTGADGALPVMDEVLAEGRRRGVAVEVLTTPKAIARLSGAEDVNAILHVTC